jgi:hypothetical protein
MKDKRNPVTKFFVKPKPRPSRKKRVLVGTALALGVLGIAGQIEKGRDAQ